MRTICESSILCVLHPGISVKLSSVVPSLDGGCKSFFLSTLKRLGQLGQQMMLGLEEKREVQKNGLLFNYTIQ